MIVKKTRQRESVWEVIQNSPIPLTPLEICRRAAQRVEGLGIATVYRTLKKLVGEGRVRSIQFAGLQPHYESTDKEHHHFFVCEGCNQIFDIVGCLCGLPDLLPSGYRMNNHEIVIYGDCPKCVKTRRKRLEQMAA